MYRYPVAQPDFSGKEKEYMDDVMKTGFVSSKGEYVEKLETLFAKFVGTKYAIAVNSGTSALTLGLAALGIGKGDEVIVPEFTMIASANAVVHVGAKPVFVDCDNTLNIDVKKIEEKITSKTKAIMPVHIYGRSANMYAIKKLAKKHKLFVIEDACEAHGATFSMQGGSKKVGSIGDVGCFSFYGNKIVTSGEGGIVVTDDKEIAERCRSLKSLAFDTKHTFLHKEIGWNFRMTNMQAAICCAQMERIQEFLSKRQMIQGWYDEFLKPFSVERPKGSVLWMYDILVPEEHRDYLMMELETDEIESRYFFKPMSMQPPFKGKYEDLKAYDYSKRGLYLPAYVSLTYNDVLYICQKVKSVLKSVGCSL